MVLVLTKDDSFYGYAAKFAGILRSRVAALWGPRGRKEIADKRVFEQILEFAGMGENFRVETIWPTAEVQLLAALRSYWAQYTALPEWSQSKSECKRQLF
jgi:hypothetical protein